MTIIMALIIVVCAISSSVAGAINYGSVSIDPVDGITIISSQLTMQGYTPSWTRSAFPSFFDDSAFERSLRCSFSLYGLSSVLCPRYNVTDRILLSPKFEYPSRNGTAIIYPVSDFPIPCRYKLMVFRFNGVESCVKPIFYMCPVASIRTCSLLADEPNGPSTWQAINISTTIPDYTGRVIVVNDTFHSRNSSLKEGLPPSKLTVCFPLSYAGKKFGSINSHGNSPFGNILVESIQHYLDLGFHISLYDNWGTYRTLIKSQDLYRASTSGVNEPSGFLRYFDRTLGSMVIERYRSDDVEAAKQHPFHEMDKVFTVTHCVFEAQIRGINKATVLVADPDEILYCPQHPPTYPEQIRGISYVLEKYAKFHSELKLRRCSPAPRHIPSFEECMNGVGKVKNNQSIFSCFAALKYAYCTGGKTMHTVQTCPMVYLHGSCRKDCPCPRAELRNNECVLIHLHLPSDWNVRNRTYLDTSGQLQPLELIDLVKTGTFKDAYARGWSDANKTTSTLCHSMRCRVYQRSKNKRKPVYSLGDLKMTDKSSVHM